MLHTQSTIRATIRTEVSHEVVGFFLIPPPAVVKPDSLIKVGAGFICKDKGKACNLAGKLVHWELKMDTIVAWSYDDKLLPWDTQLPTASYATFAEVKVPGAITNYELTVTFPAQEVI